MGVPALPGGAGVLVTELIGRLLGGVPSSRNAFTATYSEGIAVGYRWYDQQNIQPLFPFGHGLSYTRFEYSDLAVKRGEDGIQVSFALRNTGSRRGAEVAQVYVGPAENPPVPMMPRSLVGFERVELEPGRAKTVSIHVAARVLSYWSTEKQDWVVAEGSRRVYVGASSRDIKLEGTTPAGLSSSR
jgi:beta-glucosidase